MMIGLCGMSYFSSEQKGKVQYHNVIDAPPPPTTLELVPSQFDIIDDNNTSSMVYNEKNYDDTKMTKNNKKLSCDVDNLDSHNIINDEVSFCNLKVSRRTFGLLFGRSFTYFSIMLIACANNFLLCSYFQWCVGW